MMSWYIATKGMTSILTLLSLSLFSKVTKAVSLDCMQLFTYLQCQTIIINLVNLPLETLTQPQ